MVTLTERARDYLKGVSKGNYVTLSVKGSVIDYVEELGGSFLSVKNPSSSSSCGCGESFGI